MKSCFLDKECICVVCVWERDKAALLGEKVCIAVSRELVTGGQGIWPRGVNVRVGTRADFSCPLPILPSATESEQNQKRTYRLDKTDLIAKCWRDRQSKSVCLLRNLLVCILRHLWDKSQSQNALSQSYWNQFMQNGKERKKNIDLRYA